MEDQFFSSFVYIELERVEVLDFAFFRARNAIIYRQVWCSCIDVNNTRSNDLIVGVKMRYIDWTEID